MRPKEIKRKDWFLYNMYFYLEHFLGLQNFNTYLGKKRMALYHKIGNYLQDNYTDRIIQVEEIEGDISKEEFIKFCYAPGIPKVFRGAAKKWKSVQEWNLDFFEEKHGHKKIILTDNVGLADQDFEELTLKHYIKLLKSGTLKYLRFSDIVKNDNSLKQDFNNEWLRRYNLPFSWDEDHKMFMGGKNSLTPLHAGFSYFLFIQVMGTKKWILYPPNNRIYLDAKTDRTFHFYSKANPHRKDDKAFPLFKYAEQYEVTLQPGDVLWVPSFFWHYVENPTDTIGIRYGNSSIFSAWKSSKQLTNLIFLATKPSILEHFWVSRTKKETTVFTKSQKQAQR